MVCYANASEPFKILDKKSFPTTTPEETVSEAIKWLKEWNVQAVGIASFGPLDLDPESKTFGFITSTPKPYWNNFDFRGTVQKALGGIPVEMQTDVNAAAQSEMIYGNHGKDIQACGYITVGTGVGCGIMIFGKILKGFAHSECGHITVKLHPQEPEDFKGTCPFHGNCVEGLVSAGAIASRLKMSAKDLATLGDDHWVWDVVANYLAQLCMALTLISSPQVIVVGGGVLKRSVLYPKIRSEFTKLLNGYVPTPGVDEYIVRSPFEDDAGAVGSLELGRIAFSSVQ